MPVHVEKLDFPVYGLSYDDDQHLLAVVGGGGPSKSGVKNSIVH